MVDIHFSDTAARKVLYLIRTKGSEFWSREREQGPIKLFQKAAQRVPAYRDFLKKNRISPDKIKTFKDFQLVPSVSKKNYLRQYSLENLCWDGTLKKPLVFTSTSGSTGNPFYFPRNEGLDWEASISHELFLSNALGTRKGPTLIIVGFGMGVWIGGLITYKAFEIAAHRSSLEVSLITPGFNKSEIFKALRELAPHFQQTILAAYPPFLKDIIDEAPQEGISLKRLNIRFLSAAEAFTEKFRDYIVKKAGITNVLRDTMSVYGTADIGAMAWETPGAILARRLIIKNHKIFKNVFHNISKTPTLAQYNPYFVNFESINGELLITGNSEIPLIRYEVGDHGGVFDSRELVEKLKHNRVNFVQESRRAKIALYELPYVYVFERKDLSTTLYGLQIYPETIREVLIENPLNKFLTGKFTMFTKYDTKQNQYLEVHLELRKGKNAKQHLERHALKKIVGNLRVKNSEFREILRELGDRVHPKLVFWPKEHPLHFGPGTKQKWVKKLQ